jgi:microcystin-dependent protein
MPLESATYLDDLNTSNPAHTDGLSEADSHMRLIKSVLKTTFPNIDGAVTGTPAQLNAAAAGTSIADAAVTTAKIADGDVTPAKLDSTDVAGFHDLLIPAGVIWEFSGLTAPTGWMFPDGRAISREAYPVYFADVGTTYGVGDGSTTFNIPDRRGTVAAGQDNFGTAAGAAGRMTGWALGDVGGAEDHALADNEGARHYHTFSGNTGTESSTHTHSEQYGIAGNTGIQQSGGGTFFAGNGSQQTGGQSTSHYHAFSGSTSYPDDYGDPHNNVQPTTVMNFILKVH